MYNSFKEISVKKEEKILIIKFNKPNKKNCLNRDAYKEIGRTFRTVAKDDSVTVVVITGAGNFFTSGNDLSQTAGDVDFEAYAKEANDIFKEMISSLIDCPKIVITVVNGPAIGIGVTLCALSDLVWCAEHAYFYTPFTKLGLVPEAASSYLLPLLIGRSKATEMLLLNRTMNAHESYHYKFTSMLFKLEDLNTVVWPKIKEFSELPPGSLRRSKQLIRMHERDALYKALDSEGEALLECFSGDEFLNALIQFSSRKSSL